MATATLTPIDSPTVSVVSVEEYLRTSYQPDCDYVDGQIKERNVGEYEHARVQKMLMRLFLANEAGWGVNVIQKCRLQISESRFRVPDTMVLREGETVHRIVRHAPLVCIEVLSPEDTWSRLTGVLGDYLAMGVPNIWAFDPEERTAYRFDASGLHLISGEVAVDGTPIRFGVADVFPATA